MSGAIAERARFETYLLTSFWMSFWVYPVVVHWVWGGGFLSLGNPNNVSLMQSGVVDFAGCGPVHMVGGMAGFVGAIVMGPRIGRFDKDVKPVVSASRGTVSNVDAYSVKVGTAWRVTFDVTAEGTDPVELRLFLRQGDTILTETWAYQFLPLPKAS